MPEYIEREAVLRHKRKMNGVDFATEFWDEAVLCEDIRKIPAADVVEVVRCKDCEHWGGVIYGFVCRKFSGIETKICMHADDFCSCGERMIK